MFSDEDLVDNVRRYRVLYDKKHSHFKDPSAKRIAWQTVGSKLCVSADDAEQRWSILRNRYASERRKLKHLPPETAAQNVWQLYDKISFLSEFVVPRRSYPKCRPSAPSSSSMMSSLVPQLDDETNHGGTKSERDWMNDSDSNDPFATILDGGEVAVASSPDNGADPLVPSPPTRTSCHSLDSTSFNSQSTFPSSPAAVLIASSGVAPGQTANAAKRPKIHETVYLDVAPNKDTKAPAVVEQPENGDILFGHSVGLTLMQFSKKKKARAKIEILQVLEKYEDEDDG